jgi:hypothetical protein
MNQKKIYVMDLLKSSDLISSEVASLLFHPFNKFNGLQYKKLSFGKKCPLKI